MESVLTPPVAFKYEENMTNMASGSLRDSWEKWKKGFQIYSKACELDKKTEEIQINIFLHVVGEQCREIVDQSNEKWKTLASLLSHIDAHFKTKKNVTVERHRFFTREQTDYESIDQYVFELRKLAQSCEFGELCDGLIKDRLICGVTSAAIRKRLLREDNLTLSKALEICRAAIVSRMYSENIKRECVNEINDKEACSAREGQINVLRQKGVYSNARSSNRRGGARDSGSKQLGRGRGWAPGGAYGGAARGRAPGSGAPHRAPHAHGATCGQCGGTHRRFDCPAYGKRCMTCSKLNHFARMCRVFTVEESEEQSEKGAPGRAGSSSAGTSLIEPDNLRKLIQDSNAGFKDPLATEPPNTTPQCRFCAEYSKDCIEVTDKDRPYLARNKTALTLNDLSVELDFNDDALPKTVCRTCDSKLLVMFDFVKQVKEAQDSLINVREYVMEIETVVVKNECESPTPDKNDDYIDDKDDIVHSVTVTDTALVKPNKPRIKHKRKCVEGTNTHKKPRVTEAVKSEKVEIIIDVKEETAEMVDIDETGNVEFNDTEMDTKPSELELQTLLKLMK